jgi:hypothetical protein
MPVLAFRKWTGFWRRGVVPRLNALGKTADILLRRKIRTAFGIGLRVMAG